MYREAAYNYPEANAVSSCIILDFGVYLHFLASLAPSTSKSFALGGGIRSLEIYQVSSGKATFVWESFTTSWSRLTCANFVDFWFEYSYVYKWGGLAKFPPPSDHLSSVFFIRCSFWKFVTGEVNRVEWIYGNDRVENEEIFLKRKMCRKVGNKRGSEVNNFPCGEFLFVWRLV